jgi:ribonuclease T2
LINRIALAASVAVMLTAAGPTWAFERMDGCFKAVQACPAKSSIRKNRNPGGVQLKAGQSYRLLGANKRDATHYQVRIEGVRPADRWVAKACGQVEQYCDSAPGLARESAGAQRLEPAEKRQYTTSPGAISTNNVIAISWQPAFCQTHQSKPECASQTRDRYDASHFTLHGFWPQPRAKIFCGVSRAHNQADRRKRWRSLPALTLSADLRAELDKVMPGTQSALQRHEWIKHGTCYGAPPEVYYGDSLAIMRQINASAVRNLFAASIGKELTVRQVRKAFDTAFGAGAGKRVTMSCANSADGRLVVELIVALRGRITSNTKVADLIAAAPTRRPGCDYGVVDPAGF